MLSPWLVAGLFAPIALTLWSIGLGFAPLDANGVRLAVQTISLIQPFIAVVLYEYANGREGRPIGGVSSRGIWLAVATFLIAELSYIAVVKRIVAGVALLPAAVALSEQLVTIALPEERWFRGLWMPAAGARPLLAIGGGHFD
jgi:hypothetical protein